MSNLGYRGVNSIVLLIVLYDNPFSAFRAVSDCNLFLRRDDIHVADLHRKRWIIELVYADNHTLHALIIEDDRRLLRVIEGDNRAEENQWHFDHASKSRGNEDAIIIPYRLYLLSRIGAEGVEIHAILLFAQIAPCRSFAQFIFQIQGKGHIYFAGIILKNKR